MTENEVAKHIVDVFYKIHTTFGPGLLESDYETLLAYELQKRNLRVRRQKPIPMVYEEIRMNVDFRADLLVDDKVMVEVKSVEETASHLSQGCRQKARILNQLQCGADQVRHYESG